MDNHNWITVKNDETGKIHPAVVAGMPIRVEFRKTHEDARLPTRAHGDPLNGDTGSDVYAVESKIIPASSSAVVDIGLTLAYITPGFWFKVEARSGLGFKHSLQPHPGIIDNGYRGNCGIKLYNLRDADYIVNAGDRIAQFVYYPIIVPEYTFTEDVKDSDRGEGGFGHTGK